MLKSKLTLAFIFLLFLVLGVSTASAGYHYACLREGETLASGWMCEHTCCMLCVDDNNYQAAWYKCYGLPGCSCDTDDNTDFQPPTITISKPVEGHAYESRSVPFDITLDEVAYLLDYMEVGRERYGWVRLCPQKCSGYQGTRTFKDGEHTLTIRAIDKKGNTAKKNVTFYVDSIAPRIRRTLPPRDAYGNGQFSIQYSEDNLVSITLYYKDAASTDFEAMTKADCPPGQNEECVFVVTEPLAQGTLTYKFGVTDRAQTIFTQPIDIIIDTIPPELNVASPPNPYAHVFDTTKVPFDLETNEESVVAYLDHTLSRPKWKTLCKNCMSYEGSQTFKDGYHSITITATDAAGNTASVEREFYVDSKPPKIVATEPRNGEYCNGEFSVIYNEENPETVTLYYSTDSGQSFNVVPSSSCPAGSKQECVFLVGGLPQGEVEFYFTVEDIAGSVAESRHAVALVDTIPPVLTIHQPNQDLYNTKRIMFNLSTSEDVLLEYKDLEDRRPRWKTLCKGCSAYEKQVTFKDGFHRVVIRATDKAGNQDNHTIEFTVDSTRPKIRGSAPRERAFGNGVFFVWYTEDNPVEVVLHYSQNPEGVFEQLTKPNCPGGKNQLCSIDLAEVIPREQLEGQLYYYFSIRDISGLEDTQKKTIGITLDGRQPSMQVNSPLDGDVYTDRRINFDIFMDEPCNLMYINDNSPNPQWKTLCSKCTEYHGSRYFNYGEYSLRIRANDMAGNFEEQQIGFRVENS